MKEIFLSQKQEKENLLKGIYIPRASVESASKSVDNTLIKVILGPRRAGKSVFAIQQSTMLLASSTHALFAFFTLFALFLRSLRLLYVL